MYSKGCNCVLTICGFGHDRHIGLGVDRTRNSSSKEGMIVDRKHSDFTYLTH